ncbi:MAG: hypothetical protein ACYC2Y_07375 [Armatimonadota bacterium]
MRRLLPILLLLLAVRGAWAGELYRIRVTNAVGGPVEVSADGGATYRRAGKVLHPANCTAEGFLASIYAKPGTVAATAVHGIRIKVGGERNCTKRESRLVSIVPREFASTPEGFGGHMAGSSGIYTDIPTGESIFRNLAPFVGDRVFLETPALVPLPIGWQPKNAQVLVIIVDITARFPLEMSFENRVGGSVQVRYSDGVETVARVERPVRGVGRFDATGYTGVGRINTNHTGVLTISTAPIAEGGKDGSGVETRGGFMVQPSRHAKTVDHDAQVMVVGPLPGRPWLEGEEPIFSGYISLHTGYLAEVKLDGKWQPTPTLVGRRDEALARVEAVRITFPPFSPDWVKSRLEEASEPFVLSLDPPAGTEYVTLYVDGALRAASNTPPYSFRLEPAEFGAGEHVAELAASGANGELTRLVRRFYGR